MVIDVDSLCMGCMDLKKDGACPNPASCGWSGQTDVESFPRLPPKTVLEKRYVLGRALGQGGFGITYLSGDLQDYRKLALKEYFPSSFAQRNADRRTVTHAGAGNREPYQYGLEKFEEESKTLLKFQHNTNIVSVVRFFKTNGTGYIVMEFLDGETLLEFLKRQPDQKISFNDARLILSPIMEALKEVHKAGIAHRDVSPDNIFLCKSGPIKLLDFGAARLALRDQTKSQQLILKPGYTPEEQYRGTGAPGPWTDVYSLAATMYRCITGQVPPDALDRLNEDKLVPPGRLAKLPRRAERALLKALSVRANARQQTMEEFQQDLSVTDPLPPQNRDLGSFAIWFTLAGALMFSGTLLSRQGGGWLYWVGLVPAAVALFRVFRPFDHTEAASRDPVLKLIFGFLALLGILLTHVHPMGVVVLIASALAGRAVIVRREQPEAPRPRSVEALRARLPQTTKLGLQCIRGDLAGNTLELESQPIVFGRLPERANVVIPSQHISGAHTRLTPEAGAGRVWVEDLDSRNGTYIWRAGSPPVWVRIHRREALVKGDRFYLCDEQLAMFEVVDVGTLTS